jgi:ATP-binding cassette, subfamily B (MDR/TAP), member 9
MAPREDSSQNAPSRSEDNVGIGSRQRHSHHHRSNNNDPNNSNTKINQPTWFQLKAFLGFLAFDAVLSLILLSPLIPGVEETEDVAKHHYKLYKILWDLGICTCLRISTALYTIFVAFQGYTTNEETNEHQPDLFHPNGDRKSKAELEEEALEEPFGPKIRRFMRRPSFLCEASVFATGVLLAMKCLVRLNVELSSKKEVPEHPVFWIVLTITAICSFVETIYIDHIESIAKNCGEDYRKSLQLEILNNESGAALSEPLLSNQELSSSASTGDEEQGGRALERKTSTPSDDVRGRSEIGEDANYKAKFSDLLAFCAPDMYLMMLAFLFLMGAALTQVFIPRFTGDILDALISHANGSGNSDDPDYNVAKIPGFVSNIEKLTITAILGGIFGGCRGAIFTMVGARVNVRLRVRLMDSLLLQEIGFFDTTRTGDITSRLGSDTTLVGSSMTSSVNVFLRATVRAAGTLIFMFLLSWQLSLLAFITIPAVTILSKWYGRFLRNLARIQQKKLADGNNVSESTISSMSTVRAFGAELVEMTEFEKCMEKYIALNKKAALATLGYGTCVNTMPQIVKALVLYYGGLLVQSGVLTGGQLVSFILYLSALAESFNSLAGIYASLTRAVGGADKVFELLMREPKHKTPTHVDEARVEESIRQYKKRLVGIEFSKVAEQRVKGVSPESCKGEITLKNVEMRYPARPQRVVLDDLSVTIPAGSIVAFVGASGSGKSSIVSLIQHLYEPTGGEVCIDGIPVHELSHEWLTQTVSVVMQEPTLFGRSIRRNIIYGLEGSDNEPSQEEIEEAARLSNCSSFVEKLPLGYETEVGERGIQLSGGQKQRVAIARALVRKPKILLLDEATSALDAESEAVVQEAIDEMIRGQRSLDGDPGRAAMTVLVIAHRLSTIRNADKIFVVENGKVIETGSHDQLMAIENGSYSALVRRQIQPFPTEESIDASRMMDKSFLSDVDND